MSVFLFIGINVINIYNNNIVLMISLIILISLTISCNSSINCDDNSIYGIIYRFKDLSLVIILR